MFAGLFQMIKTGIFILVILVASQVPINGKRICDYVGDVVQTKSIESGIQWVSKRFEFVQKKTGPSQKRDSRLNRASSDYSDDDRTSLSGLLKQKKN